MFGGHRKIRKSYLKSIANVSKGYSAAQFSSDGKEPGNPSESNLHSKIQLHPGTEENTFTVCPEG